MKKAKLSNIDRGTAAPSTPTIGASSAISEGSICEMMCSTILNDLNGANKENLDIDIADDWLHRNDSYIPRSNARKTSSLQQTGESLVLDGVTQCQTIQMPTVHQAIPNTDYVEFDSALFEPATEDGVDDGHLEDAEGADNDFVEANQVLEDNGYKSYCVDVSGVNEIGINDPHDCVYHKLPKTHHVLKKCLTTNTVT